jgi:DNA-binding response OmpR family regulator
MQRVLVIDDDPAMTELLKIVLTSYEMDVHIENDGQSGFDYVQEFEPDIIVLDLLMPDIDGWSICKRIKQQFRIPILILSAIDTPVKIAEALDAGADDYLVKPVTSSSLIAHIQNLIRRSNGEKSLVKNAD